MIKKTLYFGSPTYLHKKQMQLSIRFSKHEDSAQTIPIEDIGVMILDNPQITLTQSLLQSLLQNNTAVICCNEEHMPSGLYLPLSSNTLQSERYSHQINASMPLKKQLWQQTIMAKINNQAAVLKENGKAFNNMLYWASSVKSGDSLNHEARAAAYYWGCIFDKNTYFKRHREGAPPNNLLNYGYAVLRATVARGLVASGLLPTLGIHHRNRYNAYALADDIMEPYRPFVDRIVIEIMHKFNEYEKLSPDIKRELLKIPAVDILIDGQRSPLMTGLQLTTASLAKCYMGEVRKILFPEIPEQI